MNVCVAEAYLMFSGLPIPKSFIADEMKDKIEIKEKKTQTKPTKQQNLSKTTNKIKKERRDHISKIKG